MHIPRKETIAAFYSEIELMKEFCDEMNTDAPALEQIRWERIKEHLQGIKVRLMSIKKDMNKERANDLIELKSKH